MKSRAAAAVFAAFFVSFAQAQAPHVAAYPQQVTFCKAFKPVGNPDPTLSADATVSAEARVAAVRTVPLRQRAIIALFNRGAEATRVPEIRIDLDNKTKEQNIVRHAIGVGPGLITSPPNIQFFERPPANPFVRPTGFSATTDCTDGHGNPRTIEPGASCSVYLTYLDEPAAKQARIDVRGWDPMRTDATVSIPLLLSQSPNCNPPNAQTPGRPFTPDTYMPVPVGEPAPPQAIYIQTGCRVDCGANGTLEYRGIVGCHTASSKEDCCFAFGFWKCGFTGSYRTSVF